MALTQEQAIALAESKWWIGREPMDLAMFQLFEERLCMPFDVFQEAMEKSLGRPVFTHEFGLNWEGLKRELLGDQPAPTFQQILELIPADKRIIVVQP